jgi:hypothetical protein
MVQYHASMTVARIRSHKSRATVRADESKLPLFARFEVIKRRIPTLSQRKFDPLHNDAMDFRPLMERRFT